MFVEKLNKKQDGSVYVIEEEQITTDGMYENYLQHDNASINTIKAYTGPKYTGDEITDVIKSIPSDAPWKVLIKIFAQTEKVYITYETPGDTVEADDVNQLQEAAQKIRDNFECYKQSGHINGGTF